MTQLLKGLSYINSFISYKHPRREVLLLSHFTDEEKGPREIKSLFDNAQLVNCGTWIQTHKV